MKKIYSHTQALCPKCKNKINARIIEDDGKIYLQKFCAQHGYSSILISSDSDWFYESTKYIKPRQPQIENAISKFEGCPQSCGYCNQHQQHICLPVIEITDKCNLSCPVCLKDFKNHFSFTKKDFENVIDRLIKCEGKVDVINISGGEPTLHSELESFLEIAYGKGITQVTVSTNGIELLKNPRLRSIFKKLNVIVALQFDGFDPQTYIRLRGQDLCAQKTNLIRLLEEEEIKYSLVATIAAQINNHEIISIVDHFFKSKALSLMFQPVTFTGNAAVRLDQQKNQITIPDVVKEIEKSQHVKKGDFNPLPCSHFSCFALSYYVQIDTDNYKSLKDFLGIERYLDLIANKTLPGLDADGYSVMTEKIYELWSAADTASSDELILNRLKKVLREINEKDFQPAQALALGMNYFKAIFIHHFMDINTFDFGRLVKCCNPYAKADKKFIPICAQNVFY